LLYNIAIGKERRSKAEVCGRRVHNKYKWFVYCMSVGGAEDLHTDDEREGVSVL